MQIGKLPRLAAGLLVAGTLALGSTASTAQVQAEDNPSGTTGDPPQSRSPEQELPPLSLLPEPGEDLDGGEDEAPGGHTCPDRGNTLELII